jgi:succinate dehydrogenase / fumarate reductase cytochrome b subunit
MSSTTSEHITLAGGRRDFLRARVASILAVAPLGVWIVLHLWNNLYAFQGAQAWQEAVTGHGNPVAMAVTSAIVLAPLVIHTVWGIGRLRSAKPNYPQYNFFANFKYIIQRLSAVGVLLFLGAHIWLAFLRPRLTMGHAEAFADISREMHHHAPTLIVYLLGTLGVAYHLANGLYGVAMGWGLVSSREALRKLDRWVILLFVILLGMSWGAIFALWRAGA